MSSRGKKKTTMAKLNREARLRERRNDKLARKEARREAAHGVGSHGDPVAEPDDSVAQDEAQILIASTRERAQ